MHTVATSSHVSPGGWETPINSNGQVTKLTPHVARDLKIPLAKNYYVTLTGHQTILTSVRSEGWVG